MKRQRQQAILQILKRSPVASQGDLVRALGRVGIPANQATVSRDVQELGLVKLHDPRGGSRYAIPQAPPATSWDEVARTFAEHVTGIDGSDSLIVVKTPPGRAHLVAVAVDGMRHADIVGTVAGDDTLVVIPRDRRKKKVWQEKLEALLR